VDALVVGGQSAYQRHDLRCFPVWMGVVLQMGEDHGSPFVVLCMGRWRRTRWRCAELTRMGYAESSVRDVVRAMARLSGWLEGTEPDGGGFDAAGAGGVPGAAAGALHQRVGGPQGPGTGAAVPARYGEAIHEPTAVAALMIAAA
jgi:hypothetical protein